MKKFCAILAVAIFCSAVLQAQNQQKQAPAKSEQVKQKKPAESSAKKEAVDWDFIQLMFFPGFPSYPEDSLVCGVKLGLPVSGGKGGVFGFEGAAASCMTENIKGVQLAPLFNLADKMNGAQFSTVNVTDELCEGAQFGLVNYSARNGIQFGLVNYMENGFLKFFPLVNFSVAE